MAKSTYKNLNIKARDKIGIEKVKIVITDAMIHTIECFRDEEKHWKMLSSYSKYEYQNSFSILYKMNKRNEITKFN